MRYSKCAILVFLLFGFLTGFSQTVEVTSTADAGTGTLRAALSNVPAGTTGYTINFNLPGPATENNRTIRLRSALPSIPSNVTIDGTSQPVWDVLGVSGAKIIIEPEFANSTFHGLTIGTYNTVYTQVVNVQIYGLFLRNFAKFTSLQNVNTNQGSGIVIDYRASNIKIGAPGKGNIIGGTINGILINNSNYYTAPALANISIQSNLIGVLYDGITAIPNITGISSSLYETSIAIGGDNAGEGNVIAANQTNVNINRVNSSSSRISVVIVNNKIGVNFNGTKDFSDLQLFLLSSSLEIHGVKVNAVNTDLYLRKNIISGNRTTGVYITNSDFVLTSNYIGTGIGKTELLGNGIGVRLEGAATGTIGGTVTSDLGNIIANNNYGVELTSSRQVKIMRNSFYCNKIFGIGPALNYTQAYVQILIKRPNHIEGRATANTEVELFYTQECNGICEGREYFVTVQTDATGRWYYDGPLAGNVTATATPILNGTTSQFSTAALLEGEAIVTSVTCHGNGSIKIPEPREGFTFTWNRIEENGTRTELIPPGTVQEISDLPVGQYEVVIDDGCRAVARQFPIKDQRLVNLVVNWPTPSCGQLAFPFSASVDRGEGALTYKWTNVVTNQVTYGKTVTMPEGTYKLVVTDQAGCPIESEVKEIKRLPSPIINTGTAVVGKAACGASNGVIKNITITDFIGTLTYKWYVMDRDPLTGTYVQGAKVGDDLDLVDMPGGIYMLEVKDQGPCPAVRINYPGITIAITNSVIINGGTTQNTTCGNNNGAINNIAITQGDTYRLTTSTGVLVKSGTCSPGIPFNITTGINGGLASGTYILNASNSITGCTAVAANYIIGITQITQYPAQVVSINKAKCDLDNGSITLNYPNNIKPPTGKYQWKNEAGEVFPGTAEKIENLPKGYYTLHIIDPNGCTSDPLGPYEIDRIPLIIVDKMSGVSTDDVCGLGRGTITGVRISEGLPLSGSGADAVYLYQWKNANGDIVSTDRDLTKAFAGEYHLEVRDQASCDPQISRVFKIEAPTIPLQTPTFDQKRRVCYATEIMIPITAPEEGIYQMFHSEDDVIPVMETKNGIFIFKVAKTSEYVIRRKNGTCVSDFVPLHIEVTNDNLEIKNTMTPNGDGMNDYWMISGLPDYKDINIKVYTRSGQLVYESTGPYNKPFDGRFRGVDLPAGAYYYKIDLRADCNPIGGSITLLR
ncbi:T9SS type B sorting domain-containing protein [Pedobacter hiemivivus]|uniref:T9SS type B sorting domain-containing protein n=1 Tax=Pedobacter hiemivivus TaxID=2530454 RepID=A0A4U1G829_9SPHI|nr:gliding motility-associated C-terminal domain-containing protein [Pedobacter hiemivivus]TKC60027.1 T9SS type B sorting domain-containing protein [Pedobacter hiemivivus]